MILNSAEEFHHVIAGILNTSVTNIYFGKMFSPKFQENEVEKGEMQFSTNIELLTLFLTLR